MERSAFDLRRASEEDMRAVIGLIDEAASWLRSKDTDQWIRPWPSQRGRDSRIMGHLRAGVTWILWDDDIPAATITADRSPDPHWPEPEIYEPAVYLHRIVVSRPYRHNRLGAELINWAGRVARRERGAIWIRVNAWTTNHGLHAYYLKEGFELWRQCIDDGYPSGALLQKSTYYTTPGGPLPFRDPSSG
jgi:GNAT superfamily N-acetyltransferase